MTTVPGATDMDDEVIYKHLNARHKKDLGLSRDMEYSTLTSKTLVATHRSFHRRVHDLATPGQHDHEHVGEN
jgi:hypothetical protein